jgi:hypothetical protein
MLETDQYGLLRKLVRKELFRRGLFGITNCFLLQQPGVTMQEYRFLTIRYVPVLSCMISYDQRMQNI